MHTTDVNFPYFFCYIPHPTLQKIDSNWGKEEEEEEMEKEKEEREGCFERMREERGEDGSHAG